MPIKNCRLCHNELVLFKNYTEGLKSKNDFICIFCNRSKHSKLYLGDRKNRLKIAKSVYIKRMGRGDFSYGKDGWISRYLAGVRYVDRKRGQEICDFTHEDLSDFLTHCFYCKDEKSNLGLDRINNKIGHIKSNCVACCTVCNTSRMANFSHEETLMLGQVIKQIKISRGGYVCKSI